DGDPDQGAVAAHQSSGGEPLRRRLGRFGHLRRDLRRPGGRGGHANPLERTVNRPCGRICRKTTTRAKVRTWAMLPLVQSVRKAVAIPTAKAAITVPLS